MNQHAKHAMDRYLNDLQNALIAAPRQAKEDARRDAKEFLGDEAASPDATLWATSEQQAYGHFVECYGLPSHIAEEYLQSQAAMLRSDRSTNPWKFLVAALSMLLLAGGVFLFDMYQSRPVITEWNQVPPKVSPFTKVVFEGDKILVEVNGTTYQWLGIDDIPASELAASAKKQFRDYWRKRITEDLVEVLWGMGHVPGNTVKLHLRDLQKDMETVLAAVPMTHTNRQSMYGSYPISVVSGQSKFEILLQDSYN